MATNDENAYKLYSLENEILKFMDKEAGGVIRKVARNELQTMEEIRMRAEKPLMLQNAQGDWFVNEDGSLTRNPGNTYRIKQTEIIKSLELMSENSIYAYQDEIRNGFITLKGGHRVGISGKVVLDGNSIKNIKDVSGLNIRRAREIPGCSAKVTGYIIKNSTDIYNTLIVSPPQCGKTTILRDIARVISDGSKEKGFAGMKVGIVDERSEIAACYRGIPQNDVGVRTDVLDGCPKSLGMTMLLRSMSPQVIITDEIGNQGDREAIMQIINAGVKIITTAHGYNISELQTRQEVLSLLQDKVFERFIVLSNYHGPGTVEEIVHGPGMEIIYRRD